MPAECLGDVASQDVCELHSTPVASAPANLIVVLPMPGAKPTPVIVTLVPPAVGPALGLTEVIVGGENLNLLPVDGELVPAGAVTVTNTAPALDSGVTAVIVVAETTVKLAASSVPKATLVARVKPVPLIVT